jgi:hypothetical protein
MTSNITTQSSSFLPTTTYYPQEPEQFRIQLTTFSQQVANRVNLRTIGVHESVILVPGVSPQPNEAVVLQTGESWQSANLNLPNNRRQPFRAVFYATPNSGAGNTIYDTGLDLSNVEFTKIFATANKATNGIKTTLNYNDGANILFFFISGNSIVVQKNNAYFDGAVITFILEYMQAS